MPNTKCTHRCSVCSTFMNDRGHRDLYELKVLRKSFNIFVVQSHQFGHVSLIWARANLTIFRIGRNKIFQSLFRVLNILFCQWRVPSLFINLVSFSPDVKYGSERKMGKLKEQVNNSQMTEITGSSFVLLKLRLCLSHPSRYLLILQVQRVEHL